jgi:hypothetical protein
LVKKEGREMANKKSIKKQGVLLKEEVGYEPKLPKGESKKDNGKKKKN